MMSSLKTPTSPTFRNEETVTLTSLPNELLLEILKHAQFSSILSLSHVNRGFRFSGLLEESMRAKMPCYYALVMEGSFEDEFFPTNLPATTAERLRVRVFPQETD
jgi:hypothetical protein